MARKMGSSSLFSKICRVVLAGVFSVNLLSLAVTGESVRPFPVIGAVSVNQGRWNEVPGTIMRLPEGVTEEPIRFQLVASAGEQYFSLSLYEESRKAFQRLLKAKKRSPSLF